MANNRMEQYLHNDAGKKDELEGLPEQVQRELAAHLELYRADPVKAHLWDPIVIGVPGGPVKNLMLTHTGRKSGKSLQNVLQYFELDGRLVIVASRGGTVESPHWYLNLAANPDCHVQVAGFSSPARAETADATLRARWWPMICAEQPQQTIYQSRTSRVIPVVALNTEKPWRSIV